MVLVYGITGVLGLVLVFVGVIAIALYFQTKKITKEAIAANDFENEVRNSVNF
jgi:cbb3-type cytochrome oxidase subunit 3